MGGVSGSTLGEQETPTNMTINVVTNDSFFIKISSFGDAILLTHQVVHRILNQLVDNVLVRISRTVNILRTI